MSQMTQTMAPILPGVPPQPAPVYPQAPSPMRGRKVVTMIDWDSENRGGTVLPGQRPRVASHSEVASIRIPTIEDHLITDGVERDRGAV